jgi:hypothetical protein
VLISKCEQCSLESKRYVVRLVWRSQSNRVGTADPAQSLEGFSLRVVGLLTIYVLCAFFVVLDAEERRLILSRILRRTGSY